jgi:hypothetical protein
MDRSEQPSRRIRLTPRNLLWAAVALGALFTGLILYGEVQEGRDAARVDEVALYIREVNGVRRGLSDELQRVNEAYELFRAGPAELRAAVPRLDEAVRTVGMFQAGLKAVEPPPEARNLHAELLRLAELESALAEEVRDIGRALPAISAEARKLSNSGRRLIRNLRAADSLAGQAAAFDRYGKDVTGIADRLSALDTPAVLKASVQSEQKRLRRLVTLANGTRDALVAERPTDATRLSNRLARAASESAVVTRAQREGIEAYTRRVRALGAQERAVERERERLAAAL